MCKNWTTFAKTGRPWGNTQIKDQHQAPWMLDGSLEPSCSPRAHSRRARCSSEKRARHHRNDHLRGERESRGGGQRGHCDGGRVGVSSGRRGVRRGGCLGAWQRVERFHHLVGRREGAKDCGGVGMYECGMTGAEEEGERFCASRRRARACTRALGRGRPSPTPTPHAQHSTPRGGAHLRPAW